MSKRGSDDVPQVPRKSKRQESSSYNSPAAPLPFPEPFIFVGTLQDVNLHPETLIQHFPQLRESQQMHDLYEVVIYNGAQRRPIETYWQLWKDCRLPEDGKYFRDLVDYPLTRFKDAFCAMTPPNRIGRAIVTYHDIKIQAESQSLKALTLEASKKLTDYYLLYNCTRTTRPPLERMIPNHMDWFKEALRTIQDSLTQTQESDGIAQGQPSFPGSGLSLAGAAEPAGTGEENTASFSEAVDAMLFKPEEDEPNLKDIANTLKA